MHGKEMYEPGTHAFHSVTLRTVYIMNGANTKKEAKTSEKQPQQQKQQQRKSTFNEG